MNESKTRKQERKQIGEDAGTVQYCSDLGHSYDLCNSQRYEYCICFSE